MIILRDIFIGTLFGYGAAIPIGPINVEMVRRNLQICTMAGLFFGLGAGLADMTYLVLLAVGAIAIVTHTTILKIVSLLGAVILAWFGVMAFRASTETKNALVLEKLQNRPLWRHCLDSYLLTLMNPFTILFWSSVSAQVANLTHRADGSPTAIGAGVLLGVISWALILNLILHYTKHHLPEKTAHYLNYVGGSILLIFAVFSVWHMIW